MAFTLPQAFGFVQGIALGAPYIFPFGSDQARVFLVDTTSGNEVFEDANIMSFSVKQRTDLPQHPLEDGAMVVDHRVKIPNEVTVSFMLTKDVYRSVFNQMQDYYTNAKLIDIHMRTAIAYKMAILEMPHEENPDYYDAIPISLTFRNITFVQPSQGTMTAGNVRDANDANTIKQGQLSRDSSITNVNTGAQDEALTNAIKGGRI